MANQATFELRTGSSWQDHTTFGPDDGGRFPVSGGTLDEFGTGTAAGFSGGLPSAAVPHAGMLENLYSVTPTVLHISLSAVAPYYGDSEPGIKAMEDFPNQGGLGEALAEDQVFFTDYITNTSASPILLKFTTELHVDGESGAQSIASAGYNIQELENPGNVTAVSHNFTFASVPGTDSFSATFTLPAGQTAAESASWDLQVHSLWEWLKDNSAPDGYLGSLDASSTGHSFVDELDATGNPVAGNPDLVFASGIDFSSLACFAGGTRIATPGGETAVECLAAGMLVVTPSGVRAIRWVGHRHIDCRRHPRPGNVMPVRVRTGAFGTGMPHRDLWLSPDHAIYVDCALIPVRHLVNGVSIAPDPQDVVTYWHIELDLHDVLLAEGLPCESYLDTGNRHAFDNGGPVLTLHPDFADLAREAHAFAPLVVSGPELDRVRAKLRERSVTAPAARDCWKGVDLSFQPTLHAQARDV